MRTDGQTDRGTDMTKLTAAFRNFAKVPKRAGRNLHNIKELRNVHFCLILYNEYFVHRTKFIEVFVVLHKPVSYSYTV